MKLGKILHNELNTKGRILSAAYTEVGGFNGNLTYVYDNYGNIIAWKLDYGDMAKAVLINPNNGAIDTRYDPDDIDDPFSYRARDGFMGVEMWPGQDNRVYMQGHVVIPNPWGNVSTNGTTTTTTDDTTDKDGGDDAEPCGLWDDPCFDTSCFSSCYDERTERNWQSDRSDLMEYEALKKEEVRRDIQESGSLILGLVGFLLSFLNVGLGYLGRILGGVSLASDIEKSVRKLSDKELYKKIGAYEEGIDDKNSKYYWMLGGFSPIADVIGVCYSLCCGTSGGSGPRDPKANCL